LNNRFATHHEGLVMRRYEMVSGIIFAIVSLVQLTRTVLGWPVQIDLFTVPIWLSGVAFFVTAGLAIWAFRSAGRPAAAV
jgi:hypothetical protein